MRPPASGCPPNGVKLTRAQGGPLGQPLHTRDYTYDALGRTATAAEGTAETAYTFSGEGEDLARVSTSTGGVPSTEALFASGPGGPLAQETDSGVSFFLRDLHGDVVGLAASGGTTGTASYDAWGEPREQTGESSPLGFQADLTDPTTGLVDMGARLYAPSLGRFTTRDVLFGDLANPISLNQYVYGATSPVLNVDDLGLCANPSVCPAPSGSSSSQKKKWYSTGAAISPPSSFYGGMSYTPAATSGQQVHEPPRPDVGPKVGARKFTTRDPDIARAGKWMPPGETSSRGFGLGLVACIGCGGVGGTLGKQDLIGTGGGAKAPAGPYMPGRRGSLTGRALSAAERLRRTGPWASVLKLPTGLSGGLPSRRDSFSRAVIGSWTLSTRLRVTVPRSR